MDAETGKKISDLAKELFEVADEVTLQHAKRRVPQFLVKRMPSLRCVKSKVRVEDVVVKRHEGHMSLRGRDLFDVTLVISDSQGVLADRGDSSLEAPDVKLNGGGSFKYKADPVRLEKAITALKSAFIPA